MENEFDVIIEIAANSAPVKYEFDKELHQLRVDRIMPTSMQYPCNYGFIPGTEGGDGDPVDVLLHATYPLQPGVVIRARAVGVLHTEDESGSDAKVIAVPTKKIDPFLADVGDYRDFPAIFLRKISHFFENYKKLEEGKWVKVADWGDAAAAWQVISEAGYKGASR